MWFSKRFLLQIFKFIVLYSRFRFVSLKRIVSHRVILQNEKFYSECMQCMFWGKWTFCIIVLKQQQVKQKVNWTRIHLFKNHLPIQHVLSGSKTFSTRNPSPSATTCEPSELSVATVSSLRILFLFFFPKSRKTRKYLPKTYLSSWNFILIFLSEAYLKVVMN